MASFEIYCPCKVSEIGTAKISGDTAYFVWPAIHGNEELKPWSTCKFCGGILKVVGCRCDHCRTSSRTKRLLNGK